MTIRTQNIARTLLLYLLLLSTIGPNIGFGLRMEHIVVFPLFLLFFLWHCFIRASIIPKVFWLSLVLLTSCLYCVLGDIYISPDTRMASFIPSLGRLVEPPILFIVFFIILKNGDSEKRFRKGCLFVIILAIIATTLSIFSMLYPNSAILRLYSLGEDSVGMASYSVGRFLGAFNQPLEAGIFFSVALFCLYYLKQSTAIAWIWEVIGFTIISVGGLLTLSKNFYVLGFGCVAIYLLISDWRLFCSYMKMILFMLCSGLILLYKFNENMVQAYADLYDQFGVISALSAGRFGSEGSVTPLFNDVINNGFFTGLGLGTYTPLDNGYLEYFYHGGVIALICYLIFIASLLFARFNKSNPLSLNRLQFSLGVFIALASLGGPVITANRACVVLMFLVAGLFAIDKRSNNVSISPART